MKYAKDRDRTEFGRRMLKARLDAGLTQQQVAKLLGMSQSTIAGLEAEDHGTTFLGSFAHLYNCSAYWLETGEQEVHSSAHRPVRNEVGLDLEDQRLLRAAKAVLSPAEIDELMRRYALLQELVNSEIERRTAAQAPQRSKIAQPTKVTLGHNLRKMTATKKEKRG